MAFPRRTPLSLSLLALSGALILGPSLAAQAATKSPTAASVLASASKSLGKERGVHIVVTTVDHKINSSVVADIGTASGTETYVSGTETFTITVTPKAAYLYGSKEGLTKLMGLSASEQSKVGGEAIVMKKGTSPYSTFQSNLTSTAFAQLLPPAKGTSLLAQRDKATNGYQLSWTTAKTSSTPKELSVLTISSGAKALPLKETVTTSDGSSHTAFSKWGESVTVHVPSKTIPYATVFPSS
ncbi:MAG: hypothetical protein WCF63_06330 [Acidimicrobiales bacterium]|jgi:hypothetical protein